MSIQLSQLSRKGNKTMVDGKMAILYQGSGNVFHYVVFSDGGHVIYAGASTRADAYRNAINGIRV